MVEILKSILNLDSEIVICSRFVNCVLWSCDMNSTLGSVVPLAMFLDWPWSVGSLIHEDKWARRLPSAHFLTNHRDEKKPW